jgi:ketosteroid isomerase-like protein
MKLRTLAKTGTIVAVSLLFLGCCLAGQQGANPKPAGDAAEIEHLLNTQVAAWNRGDLDAFMTGYWHSPGLTFFANNSENQGWQAALDRYKQRYQGEGRAMGQLDFSDLRIESLGLDGAFVRGKWHLKMPDGSEPHGLFTLVMRRIPKEGWKIVHDHTS